MNNQIKKLTKKMLVTRILGIFACLVAIAGIVLKYLHIIDDWLCIIAITYAMAMIFTCNSDLQNIRVGNPWHNVNVLCSFLLYATVIFLIVYGFVEGIIEVNF